MDYKITITLNTDGAAFHEYDGAIHDETQRILACVPLHVAEVIADDVNEFPVPGQRFTLPGCELVLNDYNGNKVGQIITIKETE